MTIRSVTSIIAVCSTAIFTGVMLNIGVTLGAYWKSLPPEAFLEWFAQNSHFIARSIPLALAPALLALGSVVWFYRTEETQCWLWGGALVCMIALLGITAAVHLPLNSDFASKKIAVSEVGAALNFWLIAHAARITLGLAASVLCVVAISR